MRFFAQLRGESLQAHTAGHKEWYGRKTFSETTETTARIKVYRVDTTAKTNLSGPGTLHPLTAADAVDPEGSGRARHDRESIPDPRNAGTIEGTT